MSKLVVFPRKSNMKPKAGDAVAAETSVATQLTGAVMPIKAAAAAAPALIELTEALKSATAYRTLRQERTNARLKGRREKKAKEAAEAPPKKESETAEAPAAAE